jgi:hypothetical protein
MVVKKLKSTVLNAKLKDFCFNLNYNQYKNFLEDFLSGKANIDLNFYLAEALAQALYRPIIIISALERHRGNNVIRLNGNAYRPPIILGLCEVKGHEIYTPFFTTKNTEFHIEDLQGQLQVIAYMSKSLPEAFKSRPILDLEVFGILNVLHSFQRYISGVEVTLLTDSRVLYYLFNQTIGDSSVKIKRWALKIISDYPNLKLEFIKTHNNLADYLTRQGLREGDKVRFNLKDVEISSTLYDNLPKDNYTLAEWVDFCNKNPQYLQIEQSHCNLITCVLNRGLENLKEAFSPLEILKEKLTPDQFLIYQKLEFQELRAKCMTSTNFETTENGQHFKLENGLLLSKTNLEDEWQILVPEKMVGLVLAHAHLLGHAGVQRMLLALDNFFIKHKYSTVKKFVQCCYSCFLSNRNNKKMKVGIYPVPSAPFEEVTLDLIENLNVIKGYAHILIVQCVFTDFLILHPLRSKQNSEMSKIFS